MGLKQYGYGSMPRRFQILRQNTDSFLAGSCVSITRMCRAAHVNSVTNTELVFRNTEAFTVLTASPA
ncbi:hypothetical protein DPX16_0228 [Anabarilius grahami]|uniref:Uncharacterized protein n=1 Tax=Anabarilius grahami TaxID=495550 RepID=A0A3N0Z530_ANAGA|nr:hypothetical protein DPX16_0228 [Anabarilius grahami]